MIRESGWSARPRAIHSLAKSTGCDPVGRAIANPKQDALLPAIALTLRGFVIPEWWNHSLGASPEGLHT